MPVNPIAVGVIVEAALIGSLFGVGALTAAIVLGVVIVLSLRG